MAASLLPSDVPRGTISDEEGAKAWLANLDVPRGTMHQFDTLIALLIEENSRQNLISRSTEQHIWTRHIVDSAQLLRFAGPAGSWLDLGSGAGFPGLVVALLHPGRLTLVEQRRLRADFLQRAASALGLDNRVEVICNRLERLVARPFDVISARAFAPLDRLFSLGERFSTEKTRWILPKGRNAKSELEAARASWQGVFTAEPSITDVDAFIIVAEQVKRRSKGSKSR